MTEEPAPPRPVRAFISYAKESPDHIDAVREFWRLLRGAGVDARVDLLTAERRMVDWPAWMSREIAEAEYVLVIASPEYKRAADGKCDAHERRGVQWEVRRLVERLYKNQVDEASRYLPVLLPGRTIDDIPDFLYPYSGTHYPIDELTEAGVEEVLRVLSNQPWETEPPLGPPRRLRPPRPAPASPVLTGPESRLRAVVRDHRVPVLTAAVLAAFCGALLGSVLFGSGPDEHDPGEPGSSVPAPTQAPGQQSTAAPTRPSESRGGLTAPPAGAVNQSLIVSPPPSGPPSASSQAPAPTGVPGGRGSVTPEPSADASPTNGPTTAPERSEGTGNDPVSPTTPGSTADPRSGGDLPIQQQQPVKDGQLGLA
jgi:hypothetical protein